MIKKAPFIGAFLLFRQILPPEYFWLGHG